jgi:hypothetical protein
LSVNETLTKKLRRVLIQPSNETILKLRKKAMSAVNCSNQELTSLVSASGVKSLQGVVLFALNLVILIVILFHRILRQEKEYVIVLCRAFCDALRGFAMLITGLGRIVMIKYGSGQ